MPLTRQQKKSLKEVIQYSIAQEFDDITEAFMPEQGYSRKEIDAFEKMSYGDRVMYMQKEKLTDHIYYHLLVIQSIN